MGGGLELPLACHFRVAQPGTQIALPEVKLGLLPGAGGTQRLPRAVGLETALNMIVSGRPRALGTDCSTALFDEMIDGRLLWRRACLREEGGRREAPARAAARPEGEARQPRGLPAVRAQHRGRDVEELPAPLKCIDAVAASVDKPFDEGLRIERELFVSC